MRKEVSAAPIRNVRWGWVTAVSRERAMSTTTKKLIEMITEEAEALTVNGTWKTATLDSAPGTARQVGLD